MTMRQVTRWLPVVLVGAASVYVTWTWFVLDTQRQNKVLATGACAVLLAAALLLWAVFLSGWRWRTRGVLVAGVVVGALVAGALVRIDGVDGDLVPILAWRSAPSHDAQLAAEAASDTAAGAKAVTGGQSTKASGETSDVQSRPRAVTLNDYPQFLGPERRGTVQGVRLRRDWSDPPRELWRRPVGAGWSGFAIAASIAVTQEQRGDTEMVACYDLLSGEPLWTHSDVARYDTAIGGVGPRATPTVNANHVYTIGATGRLNCLRRDSGDLVWTHDIFAEHGGKTPAWGLSMSPLVRDDVVIVVAGGREDYFLVGYDATSGELAWHAGNERLSYSSPTLMTVAGRSQLVLLNHKSVTGHDPTSGARLWRAEWPGGQPKVAQPVQVNADAIVVSSGYGVGCALYRIEATGSGESQSFSVTQEWKSLSLKAKFTNFVHKDGFLYGLDDGIMTCVDVATGKRRWKRGRFGHGQMILVEDLLLVTTENGEVLLIAPSTDSLEELGRFRFTDGKTWNSPAFAAPYLLVRSHKEVACYELPLRQSD